MLLPNTFLLFFFLALRWGRVVWIMSFFELSRYRFFDLLLDPSTDFKISSGLCWV